MDNKNIKIDVEMIDELLENAEMLLLTEADIEEIAVASALTEHRG